VQRLRLKRLQRREFITLLGGAAAAWPLAARAQQSERVRRIGVLMGLPANDSGGRSEVAALKQGLEELGWIDGRNLEIRYSWPGGGADLIQAAAKELVGLPCDVIVARSTPVTAAVLKETRTIPIVFVVVVDPVGSGFVQSFARPGGNVTGFQNYEFTMVGKWLQLLQEIAPRMRSIAYLHNPTTAPSGFLLALKRVAPSIAVQLVSAPVQSSAEIDATFAELARESGAGLLMVPDIWLAANREQIVGLAAKHGLPAIYGSRLDSTGLGLMSYGPVTPDLFRRAAGYVDRILKGEKPADLPVQAPVKYELVINLKTAKALGLDVPATLLARADEVIE
jgi:putative tryptophan/tyrosine transport system substrate-binding protein